MRPIVSVDGQTPSLPENDRPVESVKLTSALRLLLEAARLAEDADNDPWDFAVELASLREIGLSRAMCRWLIAKGYVCHRLEVANAEDERRQFGPATQLRLADESCFVITELGKLALSGGSQTLHRPPNGITEIQPPGNQARPSWDGVRKELTFRGIVVKRFRLPAPNQELILAAFEEEDWSSQIDDPLRNEVAIPPKQRLHDTIKALNQNQTNHLIRFGGNGRGTGICWSAVD